MMFNNYPKCQFSYHMRVEKDGYEGYTFKKKLRKNSLYCGHTEQLKPSMI